MPQTIITRFLGPTNHRGSRINATCWRESVTIPYPYAHDGVAAYRAAAEALCAKLTDGDGDGAWRIIAEADMPAGNGRAFIIDYQFD